MISLSASLRRVGLRKKAALLWSFSGANLAECQKGFGGDSAEEKSAFLTQKSLRF